MDTRRERRRRRRRRRRRKGTSSCGHGWTLTRLFMSDRINRWNIIGLLVASWLEGSGGHIHTMMVASCQNGLFSSLLLLDLDWISYILLLICADTHLPYYIRLLSCIDGWMDRWALTHVHVSCLSCTPSTLLIAHRLEKITMCSNALTHISCHCCLKLVNPHYFSQCSNVYVLTESCFAENNAYLGAFWGR